MWERLHECTQSRCSRNQTLILGIRKNNHCWYTLRGYDLRFAMFSMRDDFIELVVCIGQWP